MSSRTFTLDELESFGADVYGAVLAGDSWDSRWALHTNIVFKADGKLYQTVYTRGLTEYQDYTGWDQYMESVYDPTTKTWSLTCPEVEIYEEMVPVKKWRKV